MNRNILITGIFAIIASLAGPYLIDSGPGEDRDAAARLGLDFARFCQPTTGRGSQPRLFFRLAMAEEGLTKTPPKNELKPFNRGSELGGGDDGGKGEPPLWKDLGRLHYPVTTSSKRAQQFFDQGLRLTYAFNHLEALRAYKAAQKLDPGCAMCYWGEALVLGPNINAPMDPAAAEPSLAAVTKAALLASHASERERALIGALVSRYSDDPKAARTDLDVAYADAMTKVAARFPDDQDIAVLHAEAMMDTQPWDYWEAGGSKPKGRTAEIVATLERALRANPDHPGAIHYYIHLVEASTAPERAVPYAERLGRLMPGAGHVVHMPFHIFFRIGRYKDALEANRKAVAVDEAYIAKVQPTGLYRQGYYPHNVHSLMVSAQMAGDGKTVIDAAQKLDKVVSEEAARAIPWVQPIKAAPYLAHAQFSKPAVILGIPDPGNSFPFVKGIWHYARGVAFAAQGDIRSAQGEVSAIAQIESTTDFTDLMAGGVPAKDILQIAGHIVVARAAQATNDLKGAATAFEAAVASEDKLAYSEPPYWYYPVRQSLGAVYLQAGDLDRAEEAFRVSLSRAPNNGWALYGLAETYKARGEKESERATRKLLSRAWVGNPKELNLARL